MSHLAKQHLHWVLADALDGVTLGFGLYDGILGLAAMLYLLNSRSEC